MPFALVAAPYTPFDPAGNLALGRVPDLARHLVAAGVDGVFVAGSTGEGLSLTSAERCALTEAWVEAGEGLRVLVHVGHASLREARELARHAERAGADGIAAAPPSWYPVGTSEALRDLCVELASATPDLPFFYYHIPVLSGVQVPMAHWLELARPSLPNLAGVKYTHLDALDFQACVRDHGEGVELLWGCDEMLVTGLALGAQGAVGSTYNFATPLYRRLIQAWAEGHAEEARREQSRAAQLVEVLARHGYMGASKTVLKWQGVDCGPVRRPLVPFQSERALREELESLGLFEGLLVETPR